MRIGVNTLFLLPGEVGGSETYLRQTLRALTAVYPDVGFVLFTNRENDASLRDDFAASEQFAFEPLGVAATSRPARIFAEQRTLPRRARRAGIDLLWSPGYTAPLRAPVPQAVSILDMQYKSHPEDFSLPARMVTDVLVQAAARRAAALLAISEFGKAEILRHTKAPAQRLHVTPLAAAAAFATPVSAQQRGGVRRRYLGDDRPFVLAVSHSYPHKNLDALPQAWAALETKVPHRLLIVGQPGRGEPALDRAIATLADPSRVHRVHRVPGEDLVALYQEAASFVFPSRYEGFGLPVLEALAAGVPVVASHRASIPEVGGDAAQYFDPDVHGDLARVLRDVLALDQTARAEMIARGRHQATRFSWRRTAELTMAAFRAALD